jgi:hypothetical protein
MALIIITGMLATIEENWDFVDIGIPRQLILSIHTGAIFKLQAFYPIVSGLGLIGLLITGISITGLFGRRSKNIKPLD